MKKEKYLITGASGFVSGHFLRYLDSRRKSMDVLALDQSPLGIGRGEFKYLNIDRRDINLLDEGKVLSVVRGFRPDFILHLAACSSVAYSWQYPNVSFQNNTNIFLNIVEAVRKTGLDCRILSVGSSEEYGNVHSNKAPIAEDCRLQPLSPYAVARVAQEMLSRVYADSFGLDIVMTRSFNHIGPGQRETFVVSSLIRQIVLTRLKHRARVVITAGDTGIVRDFLDVRDVVKAYDLLLRKGEKGVTYNVCSGRGYSISELIDLISEIIGSPINVKRDPLLIRPNDNRIIVGSNARLKNETGWRQTIGIKETLKEMIEYWENALRASRSLKVK
ncbi:MAG TPA: GDP-mannose 4,6-dehydratase [Candidatus Omnitrophota bacterium]|nr:GDP-mannose 4,6-dehydratase [Candidatus Omnitrophota bacterium]